MEMTKILILIALVMFILSGGCTANAWRVNSSNNSNDAYVDYNKGSVFKDTIQRDSIK